MSSDYKTSLKGSDGGIDTRLKFGKALEIPESETMSFDYKTTLMGSEGGIDTWLEFGKALEIPESETMLSDYKTTLMGSDGEKKFGKALISVKQPISSVEFIYVVTADELWFKVNKNLLLDSYIVGEMKRRICPELMIPITGANLKILFRIIECFKRLDIDKDGNDEMGKDLLIDFTNNDQSVLLDLIKAANFLQINWLLDITCQTMAHMIQDYNTEEFRKCFKIENDFTPDEEKEHREKHQWAFEVPDVDTI